ncbi:hypothetical protein [Nocardiopsis sp. RV163]|uniref:hypothetical protein n=1 Tax=Nocardiopsis sp. RV163 TaxID=1661388 RepID=UPI001F40330A|nr:hypothetical protein [Nocardiopsis sp. RV163]
MCTPTGGLINPAAFPVPTAGPATLERQARDLRREGANVAGIGGDIKSAWAGLSSCYSAPEAETLYAVVDPVATDGDKVETSFDKAASALETFAEAVRDIKGKWSTLKADSYAFLNSIEGDDDWREADGISGFFGGESDKVEEHQALLDRADALRREYEEAERACANAINADIPDRTSFVAGDGDGESAPGEFEHGYDGYLGDVAMAWGGPMETDHGWWVDAGAAVGDFFVGIAEDVGGITGMYSSEGWFEMSWGDAMWEYHEGNLQSLASLAGMYDSESDSWGWSGWDTVGNAWKDAAHAVVPWEEWGERPGYVIGTALLNIGATVGGAALTATGVGAVVGVPLMAWRGSAMLNRMGGDGPSVPDVDVPDMSRINLSLPRFGDLSLADLRIDLGQLREGAFSTSRLSEMQNLLSRFTGGGFFGGGDNPGGNGSGGDGNGSEGSNSQRVANHHGDEEGGPAGTRPAVNPTTRELDDSRELLELLTSHPDSAELGDLGRRVLGGQGGDSDAPRPNRSGQPDLEELDLDPSLEAVFSDMNAHASDYPAWEANQSPDGPESGRVPALVGGGNNDTFDAQADAPRPDTVIGDRSVIDVAGLDDLGDGFDGAFGDRFDADGPRMSNTMPEVTNRDGNGGDPLDTDGNSPGGTDVLDGSTVSSDLGGTSTSGRTPTGPVNGPSGSLGTDSSNGGNGPEGTASSPKPVTVEQKFDENGKPISSETDKLMPNPKKRFGDGVQLDPHTSYRVNDTSGHYRGTFVTDADGKIKEIHTDSDRTSSKHPELLRPRPNVEYHVDGKVYRTDENMRTVYVEGDLTSDSHVRNDREQANVNRMGREYYEELNKRLRQDFAENPENYPGRTEAPQYEAMQWNGGHLIGSMEFGGFGERLNQTPMLEHVNQSRTAYPGINGSFRNLETSWEALLDGDLSKIEDMDDSPAWRRSLDDWQDLLDQGPNPPSIHVKIRNVFDPSMEAFELKRPRSTKLLAPPPSEIIVEWTVNGQVQRQMVYPNVPPLK